MLAFTRVTVSPRVAQHTSILVGSVLMVAACSSSSPSPPAPSQPPVTVPVPESRSGSRLRVEAWSSPDGVKLPIGFYDSLLLTQCYPGLAADGIVRCLPYGQSVAQYSNNYSDAACMDSIFVGDTCDSPRWGLSYVTALLGCYAHDYVALGAPVPAPASYTHNGSCVSSPTPQNAKVMFPTGAPIDPAQFVKGKRTVEQRGASLAQEFFEMEDGARLPIDLIDTTLSAACHPEGGRCLPYLSAYISAFADATCTTDVASFYQTWDCAPPDSPVVERSTYDACGGYQRHFAKLGAPLGGAYSQSGPNKTCEPTSGTFFAIGDELLPTDFPELVDTQEGSGRLVRAVRTASTGEKLAADSFIDTQLQIACKLTLMSDGKTHCTPPPTTRSIGSIGSWAYSDAACTKRVYLQDVRSTCQVPTSFYSSEENFACKRLSFERVFRVGARVPNQPDFFNWSAFGPADCKVYDHNPFDAIWGTTEVSPDEFAIVSDVIE